MGVYEVRKTRAWYRAEILLSLAFSRTALAQKAIHHKQQGTPGRRCAHSAEFSRPVLFPGFQAWSYSPCYNSARRCRKLRDTTVYACGPSWLPCVSGPLVANCSSDYYQRYAVDSSSILLYAGSIVRRQQHEPCFVVRYFLRGVS